MKRLYWPALLIAVPSLALRTALCLLLALASCGSATEDLAHGLNSISNHADSIIGDMNDIAMLVPDSPEVLAKAEDARDHAIAVKTEVDTGQERLTHTKNEESTFDRILTTLQRYALPIAIVGIVVLAFLFPGVRAVINSLFALLGWIIPKPKRSQAELDVAALDPDDTTTIRESIAHRRASDPQYDKAFEQELKRRKKAKQQETKQ